MVSNSLKYARDDVNPIINIEVKKEADDIVISVIDNGMGFDMKFKDKIFEQFERLHSAAKFSGTGMGLAIVKKIVDIHKGRIELKSKQGKGSTFQIFLPIRKKEVNASGKPRERELVTKGGVVLTSNNKEELTWLNTD